MSLNIYGDNSSYYIELTNMSTTTRYHVFIADISSTGVVNSYICRRSSLGTSGTWRYPSSGNATSGDPYKYHDRPVIVRTSTSATSHQVGNSYSYDQVTSGTSSYSSKNIPAASRPTTWYGLTITCGNGISSFNGYKLSSGSSTEASFVTYSVPTTTSNDKFYITSISPNVGYTYPIYATDGSSTWVVKSSSTDWSDHNVSFSKTLGVYRAVELYATPFVYYKRVYQPNEGSYSSDPSDTYALSNKGYTVTDMGISTTKPYRTGYDFIGYTIYVNGTDSSNYLGIIDADTTTFTFTLGSAKTYTSPNIIYLKARWKEKTKYDYYLNYNANRGSGAPAQQTWLQTTFTSHVFTIPDDVPTRSGYKFLGWAETQTATTATKQPGDFFTLTAGSSSTTVSDILYAVWGKLYYGQVMYDLDGGSMLGSIIDPHPGPVVSRVGSGQVTTKVLGFEPTKSGYHFYSEGWGSARATIASQYWRPGADITISCLSDDESNPTKKTIYAVWLQEDPYYYGRVVYHGNGGTPATQYSGTYSGQSNLGAAFKKINLSIPSVSRTGYTLSKWNTKPDGSGDTYRNGAEFDLEMRSTNQNSPTPNNLYAIWTINQYTINFNPNGGTPTPTPKRANYNTSFSLSTYSEGVTWRNHTLIGWDTNPNATTPTYGPSATYTIKGDATLYAIWEIFEEIDPFYWHGSDSADNSYFKANYLAENAITYLNWNALKKKVKECRDKIDGATYTYTEVKPWDDFSYREFNEVRNEIAKISGHGTLPSTVSAYQQLKTSMFNGSGSLKSAINQAINNYNP